MSFFYKAKEPQIISSWLAIFLFAELFSWLAFNFSFLSFWFLAMIFVLVVILGFLRDEYLLYLPLAELFWGSLGHSLSYQGFGLRLFIFAAVIFVFIFKNITSLKKLRLIKDKKLFFVFIFSLLFIIVASLTAYFNGHSWRNIFFDANAYFYILYLPIWLEVYSPKSTAYIWRLLQAAALIVAAKTLIVLHLFSQNYSFFDNHYLYRWIRDTRTGEITPFADNFFRVFFQSHFYLLVAFFGLFINQLKDFWQRRNFLLLILTSAALFISLSRSLWLGGALVFLFFLLWLFLTNKKVLLSALLLALSAGFFALVSIEVVYNLPKFNNLNIFKQRGLDLSEAAVSSRQQLWGPLWQGISQKPWLGHGFGKELTYQSSDPRIKNQENPEGWHSTYAFEWGWLDIWLKGGIFFVLLFVFWLSLILVRAYNTLKKGRDSLAFLLPSVFALAIVHFFSPYINHPLGLGLLILGTVVFSVYE
ncbi:MAG: O-antigen ligase family protein [Patescibacteria group bacterium]|nr:O-antigen ligase family protein [Patescibacteria group bacterium]